ncbi:polysaccharide pyruvyl transferase family protein [Labilibaculum sp. DW002]|uniref:Polysaccharide pyruvyl transferase family protein n=1 Tax=Paralabilibaculum antarcticum TaxID=2912572 RepID=A0ABT5VT86_9BACT|nr:polysaccharide pyruvyl transferase family protein [Labilibaculum sp. DW002]MDE5418644.1 polysaccharide pyruvyl transferase family protein [Labilibaculum sp. DW002]
MKFGLLVYWDKVRNIGEYIQSLAPLPFLPQVDQFINKETLSDYSGDKHKLILNGWFMHYPQNWPPSNNIKPLIISFHISPKTKDLLLNDKAIEYYKLHEPIGCRDHDTLELLKNKGVNAYFSGCLTLALDRNLYKDENYQDKIIFSDVLYNMARYNPNLTLKTLFRSFLRTPKVIYQAWKKKQLINKLFPKDIRKKAKYIIQERSLKKFTHDERFDVATDFLKQLANAKLVVTSRLHTALPCLAFGTPVIFIDGKLSRKFDSSRLSSYTDSMLNTINMNEIQQKSSEELHEMINKYSQGNPNTYLRYRNELIERVQKFINKN